MLKIVLGCDHAGFDFVQKITDLLQSQNCAVTLTGTFNNTDSVDYPDFAKQACKMVISNQADFAILICGTGIGMSIAANKIKGIRAANVSECYSAKMCRMHNNANVLCLGSRILGINLALEIVSVFISTNYEGGRHQRRLDKLE